MKPQGGSVAVLAMAVAIAAKSAAWAAGLTVTPIPMTLSPGQPSGLLKVTNNGGSAVSIQIQTFLWRQAPDGTMDLIPSLEVVAFPQIFTLGSNDTRNVRIGVLGPSGTKEQTYRIIVKALPPPPLPGRSIEILPGFDLPVYVIPARARGAAEIATATIAAGMLTFAVADRGTAHIFVQRLTVTGQSEAGQVTFAIASAPSYVLAGGRRDYAVQIAAHDCAETRKILIAATLSTPPRTVTRELAVPPGACRGNQMGLTGFSSDTGQGITILAERDDASQ